MYFHSVILSIGIYIDNNCNGYIENLHSVNLSLITNDTFKFIHLYIHLIILEIFMKIWSP